MASNSLGPWMKTLDDFPQPFHWVTSSQVFICRNFSLNFNISLWKGREDAELSRSCSFLGVWTVTTSAASWGLAGYRPWLQYDLEMIRLLAFAGKGLPTNRWQEKLSLTRSCSHERGSGCHSLHSAVVFALALVVKHTDQLNGTRSDCSKPFSTFCNN